MTEENGRPAEPDELPARLKTINQIVAWNIAWYRNAAGLKQEELGKMAGGRSKRNISADERSWDGDRTREFSASEIVNYATAFGIPIIAFFLPPEDDGITARYLFRPNDSDDAPCLDMGDLMAAALHDSDDETIVMNAYRRRLLNTVGKYLHESWSEAVGRWMRNMTPPEVRAQQVEQLRADRDRLIGHVARLTQALEYAESEKPEDEG